MIAVRYEGGKLVEVLDCKDASLAQVGALIQEADRNNEEIRRKALEELDRRDKEFQEREKIFKEKEYYSKWKLLLVIDSLLNSYQDGEYDSETHDRLVKVKNGLFSGSDAKLALLGYPFLKEKFEAIYGGLENE